MIVVVTALIGPTESIRPPLFSNPDVRYVCFTDRKDVDGWERERVFGESEPRRAARRVKMGVDRMFPGDVTIWIDASFDLLVSPTIIVADAQRTGAPIVGFAHPDRTRIRDEALEIIRYRLAPREDVERQVAEYREAGFDTDVAPQKTLTTTGLLVRWPSAAAFNCAWWAEIERHTLRDQLSVDYAAKRTGARIGYLAGHYRENAYAYYNRARHRVGRLAA